MNHEPAADSEKSGAAQRVNSEKSSDLLQKHGKMGASVLQVKFQKISRSADGVIRANR
ncbi:MAG: hypothetical protein JOZ45_14315 [Acidobacteriaceae bacterium]|nr:hypothetical protein [Acidobacteriaceae bacterium]